MDRTTHLDLRGIDASEDSSVLFRFSAGGKEFSWTFNAATMDELVALGLSGRLGKGRTCISMRRGSLSRMDARESRIR